MMLCYCIPVLVVCVCAVASVRYNGDLLVDQQTIYLLITLLHTHRYYTVYTHKYIGD